jgi:hypothetical protein
MTRSRVKRAGGFLPGVREAEGENKKRGREEDGQMRKRGREAV